MIKGQAGQPIGANIRDASNGAPFTGAVTVWIKQDTNPAVQGTVGGGVVVPDARGFATYIPSSTENAYDYLAFTFDAVGAIGDTVQVNTITPAELTAQQTANGLSSVVVNQLLLDALIEIRYGRAGDTLEQGLLTWGLGKLNRMLDKWNADPAATFQLGFNSYTPTPNHGPHTIGPVGSGADWSSPLGRPSKIIGANLILNTVTPSVRIPIAVRDEYWWLNQAVQGLATSIPTDLYYDPGWPNGSVNLWPIPTLTYPIELMTDTLHARYAMTDTLWLPYGYREAITTSLAELMAPGCGQTVSEDLKSAATDARVVVFGNNIGTRNIRTRDAGMPGGRSGRSGYNYRTGR